MNGENSLLARSSANSTSSRDDNILTTHSRAGLAADYAAPLVCVVAGTQPLLPFRQHNGQWIDKN